MQFRCFNSLFIFDISGFALFLCFFRSRFFLLPSLLGLLSKLKSLMQDRIIKYFQPLIKTIIEGFEPSEADIERLFSFAGMILRPQRCSTGSNTFEKLLLLHSNDYEKNENRIIFYLFFCAFKCSYFFRK